MNLGLAFHYFWHLAFVLLLVLWMAVIVTVWIAAVTGSIRTLEIALVIIKIALVDGSAIMPILGLVGCILCMWVPGEARGRPLMIVCLALNVGLLPLMPVLSLSRWIWWAVTLFLALLPC